jgi:ribonuclease HI
MFNDPGRDKLIIFTDGSVNTHSKIGFGAYLSISELGIPLNILTPQVKVKRFEHTSSTKLELQTLLWALSDIQSKGRKLIIYTDSQNIMGLRKRHNQLEQNNYISKNDKRLINYALYQEFFRMTDQLDCEFVEVSGHKRSNQKDEIDKLFTLVDRASRKALREDNQSTPKNTNL